MGGEEVEEGEVEFWEEGRVGVGGEEGEGGWLEVKAGEGEEGEDSTVGLEEEGGGLEVEREREEEGELG